MQKVGKKGENRKDIFCSNAVVDIASSILFKDETALAFKYSDQFDPFPPTALALILTAVSMLFLYMYNSIDVRQLECAIEEWSSGAWQKIDFSVDKYQSVYLKILNTINDFDKDSSEFAIVDKILASISKKAR